MDDTEHRPLKPQEKLAHARLLRELFGTLNPHTLAMKLQRAGVNAEGLRPYRRFLHSFFAQAVRTYLGGADGVRYSTEDRIGHFNWCLQQAVAETAGDNCRYLENRELLDYLRAYLYDSLYTKDSAPSLAQLDVLLDPEVSARVDMNNFLELWNIFEKTPRSGRRLHNRVRIPG